VHRNGEYIYVRPDRFNTEVELYDCELEIVNGG
jgi:hypothetical protein